MGDKTGAKKSKELCIVWIVISVIVAAVCFVTFLLNVSEPTIAWAIIFAFLTLVSLTSLYVAVISLLKKSFGRND